MRPFFCAVEVKAGLIQKMFCILLSNGIYVDIGISMEVEK
jgi:hypothetical protein